MQRPVRIITLLTHWRPNKMANICIMLQRLLTKVPPSGWNWPTALDHVVGWHRTGNKLLPEPNIPQFNDTYMHHFCLNDFSLNINWFCHGLSTPHSVWECYDHFPIACVSKWHETITSINHKIWTYLFCFQFSTNYIAEFLIVWALRSCKPPHYTISIESVKSTSMRKGVVHGYLTKKQTLFETWKWGKKNNLLINYDILRYILIYMHKQN